MIQPATLRCSACHAENRPSRGYCRACGASLQPVCRGCRFVNDRQDVYCGGCGSPLAQERPPTPTSAASTRPPPAAPNAELSELTELLRPLAEPSRTRELPASGITQNDLDKLFGGPA